MSVEEAVKILKEEHPGYASRLIAEKVVVKAIRNGYVLVKTEEASDE